MSPKKVALPLDLYIRVSDVRGRAGESFISPKDQEEKCRALAKARGYRVGDVFTDLDVSGGKMRRPELDKAIARIEDGISGGIIVAKLDRFARTLVGGLQTLEQINSLGGVVIVVDGEFDTSTATGELVLNMMLSLAQFELRRIRETWATAKRHAVEHGIHLSPNVPPGYVRDIDRRLRPHRKHANTIREAFQMAAEGDSYTTIARYLTDRGLPSGETKDAVWRAYRIKRMLANRVYLGEARSGHGDVNPGAHDALVDELTWNLAQRAPTRAPVATHADTLLAGLVRCSGCSYAMRSQSARGKTIATYRCAGSLSVHGNCDYPATIGMNRLDDYVLEQFLARTGNLRAVPVDDDTDAVGGAIVEAERSYRSALTDLELRSQIGDADHSRLVTEAHKRWQDLLASAPAPPPTTFILEGVDLPGLVAQLREADDTLGVRELLSAAITAVYVRPAASRAHNLPVGDRVKIVYHGEEELSLPRRGARFEPTAYVW